MDVQERNRPHNRPPWLVKTGTLWSLQVHCAQWRAFTNVPYSHKRESSVCSAWKSESHNGSAPDWWTALGFCVWMLVNFSTHVRTALLVSQVSFVFDSTASEFMLPLSKSGCTLMSWPGIKFESGLESDVNGAWSSTSEGSGLFSGETTDSDGGRRGWDPGRGPGLGLLLRVRLRFWSKPKRLSLGEEPVRLFRESTTWEVTWPTFWLKFLSKKWFVISGRTAKKTERYGFIKKAGHHKVLHN